jgi:hypothetical protein
MAPKPVRVLAVTSDFFPIEGTRRTVARCKRIWEMCGRGDCLDLVEDNSTHCYTPALMGAAAEFFARHLLGREIDARSLPEPAAFPPEQLWATRSGQVRGEIAGARTVHEETAERAAGLAGARRGAGAAEQRRTALDWLRARVNAYRAPCELNPRYYLSTAYEDLSVDAAFWWAQEGIFNHGYLFRDCALAGKKLPVSLAIWVGGTHSLQPHLAWLRKTCAGGRAALVLDVTGVGAVSPRSITLSRPDAFYGVMHTLANDLIWLDDNLPSLRTFDVLRALDMVGMWPDLDAADIRLYAHGRHGLYGRLAAALDQRIRHVESASDFPRYGDWVAARHYDATDIYSIVMPGLLEHLDLDEL